MAIDDNKCTKSKRIIDNNVITTISIMYMGYYLLELSKTVNIAEEVIKVIQQ